MKRLSVLAMGLGTVMVATGAAKAAWRCPEPAHAGSNGAADSNAQTEVAKTSQATAAAVRPPCAPALD